jgi:hypothetical protein
VFAGLLGGYTGLLWVLMGLATAGLIAVLQVADP